MAHLRLAQKWVSGSWWLLSQLPDTHTPGDGEAKEPGRRAALKVKREAVRCSSVVMYSDSGWLGGFGFLRSRGLGRERSARSTKVAT